MVSSSHLKPDHNLHYLFVVAQTTKRPPQEGTPAVPNAHESCVQWSRFQLPKPTDRGDACLCRRSMQAFSRFYFVGDEDLLEIVGNANEPAKVAQHLGKMFASVGALNMVAGQERPQASRCCHRFAASSVGSTCCRKA